MNGNPKTIFGVLAAVFCALSLSRAAYGQENLPDGKGKAEYIHNCTACHRSEMVTRVKKTPEEWRKSVDEMASRGTDGSKEDLDNVYLYLVTNFSKDKPAAATEPKGSAPPPGGEAMLRISRHGVLERAGVEWSGGTRNQFVGHGTRSPQFLNRAAGQVAKPGLSRFAPIDPAPVPGFEIQAAHDDPGGLARYLGSLSVASDGFEK
jgi:hypothetical protein